MSEKFRGKDLLIAASEKDCQKLLDMASQNKLKKVPFNFKLLLKELTPDEIDGMWEDLSKTVIESVETTFVSNSPKSRESVYKQTCLDVGLVVQAAIDLASAVFEQSMPASQGLLHMIVYLNRNMFEIPNSMENVRNNIALLCEKVFHLDYLYQDHELITFNAVIYLLKRTVGHKVAKKDVKRLYAMRSVIPKILKMGEVDANETWNLFKKCATSSLYLSMTEGQKILALILNLDIDRISEVHEAVKQHLPSTTLAQGSAYGKAYFDAWSLAVKSNSEALKNELEVACIQDFILLAIRSRQKSVVLVLRKLLAQFHSQKKEAYVSKMLYNLYQPILWRFLKDPDGLICANTAQLFLDVFPLEDPDVKLITNDQELNEQMLMIRTLLLDDFPIVRSVTIIGLCIAMSVNWELFPEDMLKTYFKIIVNDLSCDSSSADVRCAVAKGFKVLLENPLTLPTLQAILPKLKGLFHDNADPVRIAFCQLLMRVKKISAIKYYDIVPLDHLLARMEEDPVVAKAIVNLIHNSYFPKTEGPEVWLARCVEMVKADRGASRVFFQYIPNLIGLESTAKFMIQAVKAIHFYVKSKFATRKVCLLSPAINKDSSLMGTIMDMEALEEAAGFHNPSVVSGLLDAVAILWLSSLTQLEKPENKTLLKMIVSRLSKCLGDLSLYYKDTPVWESVYYLSSFMPSRTMPSLASLCFVRLETLSPDADPEEYLTLLECLCNQNESSNLLTILKTWIELGFTQSLEPPPATKKRKTKKSTPAKENDNKDLDCGRPILAVRMLNSVLDHRSCQKVVITKHPDFLKEILHFIDAIKRKIELSFDKNISKEDAAFTTGLLFALLKISVLLHGEAGYDAVKFVEEILLWLQEKILKNSNPNQSLNGSSRRSIVTKNQRSSSFEQLIVAFCKDLCVIVTDMTMLGCLNFKSLKFLKFGIKLLSQAYGGKLLLHVSKLLFKHVSYGMYLTLLENEADILKLVPDCFSKIFQCLSDESFLKVIPMADVKEIQCLLAGTLQQMQPHNHLKELVSSITHTLTKAILNSILDGVDSWEDIEKEHTHFDFIPMSKTGAFLLTMVSMKPKMIVFFLQQLKKYLAKTSCDIQSWVACYVIVLNIWESKNLSKNINKELNSLVNDMGGLLHQLHPLKEIDTNIPTMDTSIADDNSNSKDKGTISFEEHCMHEYQKLKERSSQKATVKKA